MLIKMMKVQEDNLRKNRNDKTCLGCRRTQNINEFYKAGKYIQALCKPCHNQKRTYYNHKMTWPERKITGFKGLPEILQNYILEDRQKGICWKDISKKYIKEYPTLKYDKLCGWNRSGQIPNLSLNTNSKKPTAKPTAKPTEKPTAKPVAKPTEKPDAKPVAKSTEKAEVKKDIVTEEEEILSDDDDEEELIEKTICKHCKK